MTKFQQILAACACEIVLLFGLHAILQMQPLPMALSGPTDVRDIASVALVASLVGFLIAIFAIGARSPRR